MTQPHSFSVLGWRVTIERDRPTPSWGTARFEVWIVTDEGQMRHYLPEGEAKFTRWEALVRADRLQRVLMGDEHLELVDLRTGRHERITEGDE